ncbi:MAG: C40 family peptidase [Candidatus Eremiobacteraeota bacterium]|nr:C40 family peptidase [Candidatus Eremiobacteraeota bacterium]
MSDSIGPISKSSGLSFGLPDIMGTKPSGGADLMAVASGKSVDISHLSPEAMEEIKLQQKELQKKIQDMMARLHSLMKAGKYQEAGMLMAEIQSLIANGIASGIMTRMAMPDKTHVTPEGFEGNTEGIFGDGPSFYVQPGGGYNYGGTGVVDTTGVRATLPGGGNEGVVNTALQIGNQGLPYVWGGDGPHEGGYDCSGFTHAVYQKNGINIPRTAQTQYDYCKRQGTLFTDPGSAKPGDLIFFNNPYPKKTTPVGHVMIYLGNGKMVGAQSSGVKVYDIAPMSKYIVGYGRPH